MGNGYNHHHHHLHNNLHKSTFLPMLCSKSSIKDATVPKYGDHHHRSFSDDPLSPKVGCMGQVKRHNRIMGFPTSTTITTTTTTSCKFTTTTTTTTSKFNCSNNNNNINIRYFKLKKLFSGKNLITPTTTITTAATSTSSTSSSCGSGKQAVMEGCHFGFNDIDPPINVADLDPPLPVVIKKVQKREDSDDADNLWRRRKLRNLQIQQIQIPNHQCLHPTSV